MPISIIAISWIAAAMDMCPRTLPNDVDALTRLLSSLDNWRSVFEFRFEVATAVVVLGVVAEVAVVALEFWKDRCEFGEDFALWQDGKSGAPHKPVLGHVLVELIAALFVAGGVAGEFWYEERIGVVDACIQQADNARANLLENEADNAAKSAESAQASSKVVGEQATILEATTKRLIWEGPRDILLSDAEDSFRPLNQFPGQKFRFSVCRSDINLTFGDVGLTEIGRTMLAIFEPLKRAGWKNVVMPGLSQDLPFPYFADSCASVGVSVQTSDNAARLTRDAAKALQSIVNKALSDRVRVGEGRILLFPPLPALTSDVIDIHVGLHPAKPKEGSSKSKAAR